MNNRAGPRAPVEAERQLQETRATVEHELDALGWATRHVMERLTVLAEANKTLVAQKDGIFTDRTEVPDNPTRLSAIHTILQLKRAFPSTKIEVGGVVRVEQLQEIALRLEGLSPERLTELIESEDVELLSLPEGNHHGEIREADVP